MARRYRRRGVFARAFAGVALAAAALGGCGSTPVSGKRAGATIDLRSSAFASGATMPRRYTCDGADVSPPLSWSKVPAGAAQLALTLEDLDAPGGSFTHWAIAGLDPATSGLAEAARPAGAVAGRNDFGKLGYGGPCPPRGQRHRYRFVLYALRASLALSPGFRLADQGTELAKDTMAFGALSVVYRRYS
jgi:Raf kinase inhibitor-like YbhB/YbcL family protein